MNNIPLAERMRPRSLKDYVGQEKLLGPRGTLRNIIESGLIPSMILWGPPGTGKTTLAELLSKIQERPFYQISAINAGVKDIREIIEKSKNRGGLFTKKNPILFIDEIHRFSKSQQDALLGAVEKGIITLIGATTENPSFEVINALLSRCQVFILEPLPIKALREIINRTILEDLVLSKKDIIITEDDALLRLSGGDARKLLSILDLVINVMDNNSNKIEVTNKKVMDVVQTNMLMFDKSGDLHYDIVSAFIKSIRGSDPNAAIYWLARMIEAGEDVKFIGRRLIILASEDIGNANPNALLIAKSTFDSINIIGLPEARIILSQCVIYLASSVKSNSSYKAINKAQEIVQKTGNLSVPLHLRNAPTKLLKELKHGKDYDYTHDYSNNFISQEYLPKELTNTSFYIPGHNPKEKTLRDYLKNLWKDKYNY
jgi:putative ATPase|tara:strand:+ start:802 stop:2088 length:1287 start_codon:yes stop_codon:yes gene_type:complete